MTSRKAVKIARHSADVAEAQAREAIAMRNKAFADVQRWFAVPLVAAYSLSGTGALLFGSKIVAAWWKSRFG